MILKMILAIAAMSAATIFTRAFPFMVFAKKRPPESLIQSARLIPGAVMLVLVFTSLPIALPISSAAVWLPWMSVCIVAIIHLLFNHPLISIFGGTAIYMTLLHLLS